MSDMNRYICIHGHFYQPPRENPWLEEIELQASAFPYKDWNERITSECYAPNAASRILDGKERIVNIINNYAKISFNFGPTLLSWMHRCQPLVYQKIIEADRDSAARFSGHGAAMAQAYNHMILPLANARDRTTQVLWGIADFKSRFNREPEGMWLPETAVDTHSLEALAAQGIKFTVLAPHQAQSTRRIGEEEWTDVARHGMDIQQPYLCRLPSGKEMVLFFYDGPISRDVAFSGLLNNGEAFARRLTSTFPKEDDHPRLLHIATDGETYGHHHRFGNMALSYCLHYLEKELKTRVSIYPEFMEKFPPRFEVKIAENTSWSCAHGVERWRSNCGCCIGGNKDWHQKWRAPLRKALDWLRDEAAAVFERELKDLCADPWAVRDDYIAVILNRDPQNVEAFFERNFRNPGQIDRSRVLMLLEMQRHAMLMYTSCAWFFDDIGGIESVQVMQYAARVIQLAHKTGKADLLDQFCELLEKAPSNVLHDKNGEEIFRRKVLPQIIDLRKVGAHYAISSLFEEYPYQTSVYSYEVERLKEERRTSGKQELLIGQVRIRSQITCEEAIIDYVVLHFGEFNLNGWVMFKDSDEEYAKRLGTFTAIFEKNDIAHLIKTINQDFTEHTYNLWDLFQNEQGRVLNQIFADTLESISVHFREIYDHYYPLMHIKPEVPLPLPKALAMSVEFILVRDFQEGLESEVLDLKRLEALAKEMRRWSFQREKESLSYSAGKKITQMMEILSRDVRDVAVLRQICALMRILRMISLPMELWEAQNIYFALSDDIFDKVLKEARDGDKEAKLWVSKFRALGQYLKVKLRSGT